MESFEGAGVLTGIALHCTQFDCKDPDFQEYRLSNLDLSSQQEWAEKLDKMYL